MPDRSSGFQCPSALENRLFPASDFNPEDLKTQTEPEMSE